MTTITPTQNLINSVTTQKSALNGANAATYVPASTTSTDSTSDSALTSNVSDKVTGSTSLYNASLELASLTSQLQVAQTGSQQVINILENLQSIAQQISNGSGNTTSLEAQFQSLYSQIQQIVANTSFGGNSLLNGTTSLDNNTLTQGTGQNATVNLTAQALFGNNTPTVSTPQTAADAVESIGNALNTANAANNTIENLNDQLNVATAGVQTAQANNFASTSTLTENDLNSGVVSFVSELLNEPSSAADAQTGNLSSNTLSLISE